MDVVPCVALRYVHDKISNDSILELSDYHHIASYMATLTFINS